MEDLHSVRRTFLFGSRAEVLLLALFSVFSMSALAQQPAATTRPPTPVSVVEVKPENTPATFEFTGKTASSRQVEINARVEGYLDKIAYEEGSLVKTGQLLFQLDPKPFQAALDNAKAVLAQQEALLTRARQTLARVKPLAKQNAVSQQDLDNATASVLTSGAQVQAAKAQVETARLNLGYTTIKSPLNGLSSSANFREGALITPAGKNAQLTTIVQIDPMWVNFGLGENEVLKIRAQQEAGQLNRPGLNKIQVELILADGSVYPQKGQITFVDPVINAQTGTYNIRAVVPNPKNQLSPGQFVRVQLKGAVRPNAIMVPQVAVMQGPNGKFVFVVGPDDTAQPKPIQVGDWYGDQWIVNSGLEPGDRVVVDGAVRLQPGAPVQIRPAAAPAPESAKVPSATPLKP
ncbi:MAG: efflux RND transporter periplasmic adaptor subunit [Candidatus Competibacteraceae bacterium]|nr:efflux RND transporter periplasmic adaptor subunit [Candidatus Competibacteraceae bacterium]